jgi:DNA polymerase-3 subunit gamma/tau
VTFVLATTDPQKVPVTVLSRCLQFGLKNMPAAAVADHLARVLEAESIAFERSALALLGRAAAGSMRDALSLLDQAIAFGGGQVAESAVREMLGVVDHDALAGLLEALARGDGPALIALADQLREDNAAFVRVLDELALWLHRLALLKAGLRRDEEALEGDRLDALAAAVSAEQIQIWYQIAIHGARDLPLAPEEFAGFSMTLLRMLAFRPIEPGEAVAASAAPVRALASPSTAAAPAQAAAPAADSAAAPRASIVLQASRSSMVDAAAAAAPAAPPRSDPSSSAFDGDWPALARRLTLTGFVRQFMDQSELLGVESDVFHVRVPIRPLAEGTTVGKVTDALSAALGRPVRLRVEVGAINGVTAAAQAEQQRGEQLAQARSALDADPFVRALVRDFGASIVADSVAPLPPAASGSGAEH